MPPTATRSAPAKINLGLRVLRRRVDGYHDVETALLPIGWADQLTARPADSLVLSTSDPALPTDERNLVVRAARALAARTAVARGADVHLEKLVPYGAGLGGGSSDAAATLLMLSELWGLAPTDADLHEIAAGLGADVSFFLRAVPAVGTGRGDVLTPLINAGGEPYKPPYPLVVAVPPVAVPTAEAYALVAPDDRPRPALAAAILSDDLDRWRLEIGNDFQAPIAARYPEVRRALDLLGSHRAGYVSLSGSGSAVYGFYESRADAAAAAEEAASAGGRVWTE